MGQLPVVPPTEWDDLTQNFEALGPCIFYRGQGVPTLVPPEGTALYLRTDTPSTANQRIYIWTGAAWSGIV